MLGVSFGMDLLKLRMRAGVGVGGDHQNIFSGHTKTNFADISNTFPKDRKFLSGHIKIFPKFLCFARISHCFLPDRKNWGGGTCSPPGPYAYEATRVLKFQADVLEYLRQMEEALNL
jgi:hypothetical protein